MPRRQAWTDAALSCLPQKSRFVFMPETRLSARSITSPKRFVGHHEHFVTIPHTHTHARTHARTHIYVTALAILLKRPRSPRAPRNSFCSSSGILETQIMPQRIPPALESDEFGRPLSRDFNGPRSAMEPPPSRINVRAGQSPFLTFLRASLTCTRRSPGELDKFAGEPMPRLANVSGAISVCWKKIIPIGIRIP